MDVRVGRPSVVLGLSFDFHDAAAALLIDGTLVAACEEERFSRVKHDASLPEAATAACLDVAGIGAEDVEAVVFYEKPLSVAARFLATRQRQGLRSCRTFVRDAPSVFARNLLVGYRVALMLRRLGSTWPPTVHYLPHHLSHAAAAYFPSPFDDAAVLTVDGIGEWATASIGLGTRNRLELLEELRFPDSLGLVYSFVTAFCGFRPNSDEYKVMGLAPYGRPRFLDELRELLVLHEDGSFTVDARALGWFDLRALADPGLARRFGGPPRAPDAPVTDREADLAASVQVLCEEVVLALGSRAFELTGAPNLCLAGGVALNCVANGRLAREGPFANLWVQPAAGDSGSAVGAALAYWHLELGSPRPTGRSDDGMNGAAVGPGIDTEAAQRSLVAAGVEFRRVGDPDELAAAVAERLARGAVVGWCQGRMEFGPRALGHRSLLADPRDPDVRQRLNRIVKGREDFRPFAPAVLAERAPEWFVLDGPSPYMLHVTQVRDEHLLPREREPVGLAERGAVVRSSIPACTHVDGSARVQTVDRRDHPEFHRLISAFEERTGCPILVNTSFNRAGEPIVQSAEDAIRSARAGGIDLLVIEDLVIEGTSLRGPQ